MKMFMRRPTKKEKVFEIGIFGELTPVNTDKKGRIVCNCSCGKSVTYQVGTLLEGKIKCCGHTFGGFSKKNALNIKYFGKLTVLDKSSEDKSKVVCQCSCGEMLETRTRDLFLGVKDSCDYCRDDRTEYQKLAHEQVKHAYSKDMLTAIDIDEDRSTRNKPYIIFKCDCGKLKSFAIKGVEKLEYGSCGCYKPREIKPSPTVQAVLSSKIFGRWSVTSWDENTPRHVKCICECGNTKNIRADSLLNGDSTSCGCYAKEQISKSLTGRLKSNAYKRHPLYAIFNGMMARCTCETNDDYKHYGGRGIKVVPEWNRKVTENAFENFVKDMEEGYEKGLELERLDVNGDYCKENCTWVCRRSQVNNLRTNRLLEYRGVYLNVSEWGEFLKFNRQLLDDRINCLNKDENLEVILNDTFKDRAYSLLYKGNVCSASEVFRAEGFTEGQRNGRINKHGGSINALLFEGIDFELIKDREKDYLDFEEALAQLRDKEKDYFEKHLLFKIESQLKENNNEK